MATQRTPLLLAGLTLFLWVAASGCDSALVASQEEAAESAAPTRRSKAILERYEELLDATEFVVGVAPTVLNMQAILERYDAEPGVVIKGRYRRAMSGFAMHVDKDHVRRVLDKIEADPEIVSVERDLTVRKPQFGLSSTRVTSWQVTPWGVKSVLGSLTSTLLSTNAAVQGVEVYLLDSGISNIGDLNVVEHVNFTTSGTTDDRVTHGVPAASILGAINNSSGSIGVAPGVRLHNYKVLDDNGQTDLSIVITALERIMERRSAAPSTPIVVNLSFGADIGTTAYNALDHAVQRVVEAGIVVVVAAGNDGRDAATVTPAHVAEAITVGAFDKENRFAGFSNHGPAVDLLAPGVNVEALVNRSEYNYMTGTSAAAPHVAAAAARYLSENPAATPQQVRDALVSAASARVAEVPSGTTNGALDMSRL